MINYLPNFEFKNIDVTASNTLVCPDQYVATYSSQGNVLSQRMYEDIDYFYDNRGNPNCNNSKLNIIAVIVESPHVDEYKFQNGVLVPVGPLVGSWEEFETHFGKALQSSCVKNNVASNSQYNVVFLNAVQYQCSTGRNLNQKLNRNKKDENVINCWFSGFNDDLEKRLIALKPEIIIDLSGKSQNIHFLIDDMIKKSQTLNSVNRTYGVHPSRWNMYANKIKLII